MSDNLPYLFAAYGVTWSIFFLYVFFVSRRQHEMEKEIQELRQSLEIRENRGAKPVTESD